MNQKSRFSLGKFLLNAPYVLWSAIFVVVPLLIVVYYAFTDKSGNFSLSNIGELSQYAGTFALSIWYSLIATVITLIIAYPFAYFISRSGVGTEKILIMLVMLPMWMNLLIRTYSWMNILENNGIINSVLSSLGLPTLKIIGTPGAVIFGMIYNYFPYMVIPIHSVLSKIDPLVLEAAEDLGSNGLSKLFRIVIPLSMPGVISGITMVFVPSVSTFYISQKLGGGKILLIGDVIESQMQTSYNYNLGAALSFVLMLIILLCMTVMRRFASDEPEVLI